MNTNNAGSPHPLPAVVVAAMLTLGIWLATVGAVTVRRSNHGIDVAAGSVTFRDHCGACHIVEKGITTHHGPNLYDFGKRAGDRRPDLSAAEYVLESILEPDAFVHPDNHRGMPKGLAKVMAPAELRNLIAFVVGRGATPDYAEIRSMNVPDFSDDVERRIVRREDMSLATDVLRGRGQCMSCHTLHRNSEYTVFAPALFGVGLTDPDHIRQSIVTPGRVVSSYHRWTVVYLTNGQTETGKLIAEDAERLVFVRRGADGNLQQIDIFKADIEQEDGQLMILPYQHSPMPTGISQLLSEHELDVLIRMIRQLN